MQQIAVEDIGTFAAAVIERRDAVFGRRFDIAGDDLTGDESAAILSEAADRDIHYKGVSPAFWRSQNNEDMALMYEWFDDTGYVADINGLRREFPEVHWHDFAAWVGQQDWTVLDTPEPALPTQGG